ncbi:hypothetical protein NEHOM01_1884 [Nematocida homosporus]|uniref:uncharacterized protein n=1 Tax=Nematocida homosporus TaxID=1912981 RepID=UPI002220FC49|nr:uncharacterized protein NEHOM01_1884 [Nematocida homosporus]KAI5187039.1 hypothetical protein NEHOM01_1884 [Nematocida homosporus]
MERIDKTKAICLVICIGSALVVLCAFVVLELVDLHPSMVKNARNSSPSNISAAPITSASEYVKNDDSVWQKTRNNAETKSNPLVAIDSKSKTDAGLATGLISASNPSANQAIMRRGGIINQGFDYESGVDLNQNNNLQIDAAQLITVFNYFMFSLERTALFLPVDAEESYIYRANTFDLGDYVNKAVPLSKIGTTFAVSSNSSSPQAVVIFKESYDICIDANNSNLKTLLQHRGQISTIQCQTLIVVFTWGQKCLCEGPNKENTQSLLEKVLDLFVFTNLCFLGAPYTSTMPGYLDHMIFKRVLYESNSVAYSRDVIAEPVDVDSAPVASSLLPATTSDPTSASTPQPVRLSDLASKFGLNGQYQISIVARETIESAIIQERTCNKLCFDNVCLCFICITCCKEDIFDITNRAQTLSYRNVQVMHDDTCQSIHQSFPEMTTFIVDGLKINDPKLDQKKKVKNAVTFLTDQIKNLKPKMHIIQLTNITQSLQIDDLTEAITNLAQQTSVNNLALDWPIIFQSSLQSWLSDCRITVHQHLIITNLDLGTDGYTHNGVLVQIHEFECKFGFYMAGGKVILIFKPSIRAYTASPPGAIWSVSWSDRWVAGHTYLELFYSPPAFLVLKWPIADPDTMIYTRRVICDTMSKNQMIQGGRTTNVVWCAHHHKMSMDTVWATAKSVANGVVSAGSSIWKATQESLLVEVLAGYWASNESKKADSTSSTS